MDTCTEMILESVEDKVKPIFQWAAYTTSRRYPTVSLQDTYQAVWLWYARNKVRVGAIVTDEEGWDKIVKTAAFQTARAYVVKEHAAVTGYSSEDLTWYSSAYLRKLLPDVFEYADWEKSGGSDSDAPKGARNPHSGSDRWAALLDVKIALPKLKQNHYDILMARYKMGYSAELIASTEGVTLETVKKRQQRAIEALQRLLGGPRPSDPYEAVNGQFDTREHGRKAYSNESMRAMTANNWEG